MDKDKRSQSTKTVFSMEHPEDAPGSEQLVPARRTIAPASAKRPYYWSASCIVVTFSERPLSSDG